MDILDVCCVILLSVNLGDFDPSFVGERFKNQLSITQGWIGLRIRRET